MVWSYQQLRSFSAVARTGNMTEAAAQLGYTTGAVSQQIAALEASLTTQLFIRLPRGLSLTDAGELFLREVEQIIDAYHRAESALESPSPKHKITLRLGIFTSAAVAYLPSVLERLALTHPHIEVHSTETTIAGALPALTSGLIDASLTVRYPNIPMPLESDVTATALLEEHFSILTGKLESSPKDDTKSLQRATPPATT
ncbi:MAG TPA: LysR family transcriptional regulator, partial [Microbacteriaceae bacterium]|nr:LysR family transcriptional regulator [Microbacteriaceae bacterium]